MGIILDTSVLIAGERRGEGVQAIIQWVLTTHGEQDAALSVVALVELTHGIYRARSDADRERRRAFTQELRRDMAVVPVTAEIAELAGRIEGEQAARGISIAFEDLLIGATALHMNYRRGHPQRAPLPGDPQPVSGAGSKLIAYTKSEYISGYENLRTNRKIGGRILLRFFREA